VRRQLALESDRRSLGRELHATPFGGFLSDLKVDSLFGVKQCRHGAAQGNKGEQRRGDAVAIKVIVELLAAPFRATVVRQLP